LISQRTGLTGPARRSPNPTPGDWTTIAKSTSGVEVGGKILTRSVVLLKIEPLGLKVKSLWGFVYQHIPHGLIFLIPRLFVGAFLAPIWEHTIILLKSLFIKAFNKQQKLADIFEQIFIHDHENALYAGGVSAVFTKPVPTDHHYSQNIKLWSSLHGKIKNMGQRYASPFDISTNYGRRGEIYVVLASLLVIPLAVLVGLQLYGIQFTFIHTVDNIYSVLYLIPFFITFPFIWSLFLHIKDNFITIIKDDHTQPLALVMKIDQDNTKKFSSSDLGEASSPVAVNRSRKKYTKKKKYPTEAQRKWIIKFGKQKKMRLALAREYLREHGSVTPTEYSIILGQHPEIKTVDRETRRSDLKHLAQMSDDIEIKGYEFGQRVYVLVTNHEVAGDNPIEGGASSPIESGTGKNKTEDWHFLLNREEKARYADQFGKATEIFSNMLVRLGYRRPLVTPAISFNQYDLSEAIETSDPIDVKPVPYIEYAKTRPSFDYLVKVDEGHFAYSIFDAENEAAIYAPRHFSGHSVSFRAKKNDQTVIGHAHIKSLEGNREAFEQYKWLIQFLTDEVNGFEDVQLYMTIHDQFNGIGVSTKDLVKLARDAGITVFPSF